MKPEDRVRLTWRVPGMERPATLQIALLEGGPGKTSVRVHLEHLPSPEAHEAMKVHWKDVLARLAAMAASQKPTG